MNRKFYCEFCDKAIENIQFEETYLCDCGKTLNEKIEDQSTGIYINTKMDKQSIKAERKKRSHEHFKKEINPRLPKGDRKYLK